MIARVLTFPAKYRRILPVVLGLAMMVGSGALAEEYANRTTRELRRDLKETQRELKSLQGLARKLQSAGRESSNSKRQKVITQLQDEMAECILRREDVLGMEHTIKMHGKTVTGGTTDAAKAGAPVGTSRSKQVRNLAVKDGPNADQLRRLSRMQSLYVAAEKSHRSAIEKQGDAFENYLEKIAKFEQQLEEGRKALQEEIDTREPVEEEDEEDEEEDAEEPDDS